MPRLFAAWMVVILLAVAVAVPCAGCSSEPDKKVAADAPQAAPENNRADGDAKDGNANAGAGDGSEATGADKKEPEPSGSDAKVSGAVEPPSGEAETKKPDTGTPDAAASDTKAPDAKEGDAKKDEKEEPKAFLTLREAGIDAVIQGEYSGEVQIDGAAKKFGAQVIALGGGKFKGKLLKGGLPGDGWDKEKPEEFDGTLDGDFGTFKCSLGTCTVKNSAMIIEDKDVVIIGTLTRTIRESKTLGMKAPKEAKWLLESTDKDYAEATLENWVSVKEGEEPQLDDAAICQGVNSKAKFQDCIVHIEFMLPFMPKAKGQGRGNSGVYLQGRYEVQVLDSFGLEGKDNECGGIYTVKAPEVNMCYPPLQWQTYDIKFTAAKFDASGKKTANARMTVIHNGVRIHEDVEVPKATTAAPNAEGPEPNFLHLQDHGCPVRFRNIWVLERSAPSGKAEGAKPEETKPEAAKPDDAKPEAVDPAVEKSVEKSEAAEPPPGEKSPKEVAQPE